MGNIKSIVDSDLLDRVVVQPDYKLLKDSVNGKTVLVSGAGGSIGSELCRQIVRLNPKALILYESSEYNLHCVYQALNVQNNKKVYTVLGSILDKALLKKIFSRYQIDTIFHTAAYKHVPLVECNALVGMLNNVFGTKRLLEMASIGGSSKFVLISTDKAVNPTNIMGVSKRISELIIKDTIHSDYKLSCCAVRFGNVLNSSGSVIEVFRNQIAEGGPITITDQKMERYFMTVSEAAQLVMQASVLGGDGDILFLDMGESVPIVELAKKYIRSLGYTIKDSSNPNGDIAFQFTGRRAGEKLKEEIFHDEFKKTVHPKIMSCCSEKTNVFNLESFIGDLEIFCQSGNTTSMINLVKANFPSFGVHHQNEINHV